MRGGVLYRANDSTQYDWSDLNQVRFANVATPDTITNTISLSGLNGMGDFAVDLTTAAMDDFIDSAAAS